MPVLLAAMFGIGIIMIVLASWGLSQSSFEGMERFQGEVGNKKASLKGWSAIRELELELSANFVPYTDFDDIPSALLGKIHFIPKPFTVDDYPTLVIQH